MTDLRQYQMQKARAKQRGIAFELTFDEWLKWWKDTGHYHERGKGRGKYVMARLGDSGPYALGNIECVTGSRNSKVGNKGRCHSEETKNHLRKTISEKMTEWHAKRRPQ